MRLQDIPTEQLREELRLMKEHHTVYKLIRDELKHRGRWKYKSRGGSFKKGPDRRRGTITPRPKPVFNDLFSK